MSATFRASDEPIKSTIIVPYNNGSVFTTGSRIELLFGRGQANTLLMDDTFIQFNYQILLTGNGGNATGGSSPGTDTAYIRYLPMIFREIELCYKGYKVWNQIFNQQDQFIKFAQMGGDGARSEFYTVANSKNLTMTHVKVGYNSTAGTANTDSTTSAPPIVTGLTIWLRDLVRPFQNVKEFPLDLLDNQLQLNLYLADPATYLVNATAMQNIANDLYQFTPMTNATVSSFQLNQVELHLSDKVGSASTTAASSYIYPFRDHIIALNGIQSGQFPPSASVNIPFAIVASNTRKIGCYFYKDIDDTTSISNPTVSYRPELINVNFKYGQDNSPFSPINQDSYQGAGTYRAIIAAAVGISRAQYASANYDWVQSMNYIPYGTQDSDMGPYKTDTHITLLQNLVTGDDVGPRTAKWNSQFNLQANTSGKALPKCTACMWVETDCTMEVGPDFVRIYQLQPPSE